MVSLTRRSVALLAIAACATTALAAEEPASSTPEVVTDVVEEPRPPEVILPKKGISPAAAGGAAVGVALLAAIAAFGIQVLGSKMVQADAATVHTKVAEEILLMTDKFTLATDAYTALVSIKFEEKAVENIKGLKEEEKKTTLDKVAEELKTFFGGVSESGKSSVTVAFGEGKATVDLEVKFSSGVAAPPPPPPPPSGESS